MSGLRCDLLRARDPAPASGPTHVLMLHGLGDSVDGWKPVLPELRLPGVHGLFAQAPLPYPAGDPFGWSWFDLGPGLEPDAGHIRAHRELLRRLLADLERDHDVAAERLAVIGFSQGALMALDLALRHDRAFAGVVAISGWLAFPEEYPAAFGAAIARQRILVTHGDADPVVPMALAQPRVAAAIAAGAPIAWRTYAKAHHLVAEELAAIRAFLLGAQP